MEHERGGIDRLLSNHRLFESCRPLADTSDPLVRQEIARLETAYRIGRHLVLREVLGQGPKQFSAATKTFCTEHEQRVADVLRVDPRPRRAPRRARAAGPGVARRLLRARLHVDGRHHPDPPQHHRRAPPRPAPQVERRRLRGGGPGGGCRG